MSEKLTRINCPVESSGLGVMDWGEKTPQEMLALIRSYHRQNLEDAQRILALPDDAFQIDVVRGSVVQHHVRRLQEASPEFQRKPK